MRNGTQMPRLAYSLEPPILARVPRALQLLQRAASHLCLGARSWVQEQLREHGGDLWISGAEDYARHARDLLQDFADVISQRSDDQPAASDPGAAAQVPVPTSGAVLSTQHIRARCSDNAGFDLGMCCQVTHDAVLQKGCLVDAHRPTLHAMQVLSLRIRIPSRC